MTDDVGFEDEFVEEVPEDERGGDDPTRRTLTATVSFVSGDGKGGRVVTGSRRGLQDGEDAGQAQFELELEPVVSSSAASSMRSGLETGAWVMATGLVIANIVAALLM